MESQLAILCLVLVVALVLVEASGEENSLNLGQTNRLGPATGRMRETETILSVGDWAPVDSFDSNTYSSYRQKPPVAVLGRFNDALAARVQNSVASDDYSLDITPAVRFALGLMIILVSLSVILDISKNLKEKAAPILETLRSMAPASSARSLESLGPIAELANQAFSAFEKFEKLQNVKEEEEVDLGASQRSSGGAKKDLEEKPPSSIANVLMKFMKFKQDIDQKKRL